MSANSKIEWCDATFNPWIGCTKVSPGCAHCYAETRSKRTDRVEWGKGKPRKRTSTANWKQPLKWNRDAAHNARFAHYHPNRRDVACFCANEWASDPPQRPRVFCASLADWLDDEVPIEWLADLLALIHATPNLDWLLLTKRPENFGKRLNDVIAFVGDTYRTDDTEIVGFADDWRTGTPPHNVWIGTSVEDQPRADERIPDLLQTPARIRFLSCEPLLGVISLENFNPRVGAGYTMEGINWVIIGGESGHGARPCHVQWIRSLVAQCKAAGVPAFVKQFGAHPIVDNPSDWVITGHGRRDRKGGDPSEWPEDLRVREFPKLEVPA